MTSCDLCCRLMTFADVRQTSNVENLPPQTIRLVARELASLQTAPPEGIRVLFSEQDVTQVEALIDGPGESALPAAGC